MAKPLEAWTPEELRFERCYLPESSLIRTDLTRASFTECDLSMAVLSGSRMRGADLRGCRTGGIRATLDDLAGAILDPDQAAAVLLGHADIRVLPLGVDPTSV